MTDPVSSLMNSPARRVWAGLVVGVVGLAGGVTTALLVPDDGSLNPVASINDPLRLGVPLVSPGCNGEAVLVLGTGGSAPALTAAISSAPEGVRYLRTDESCSTRWTAQDDVPAYVAYLGPFDDETTPCRTRMDGDHVRDEVTNLNAGTDELVRCVCVLPDTDGPELSPPTLAQPARPDPLTISWVSELQHMLDDVDTANGTLPAEGSALADARAGVYDTATSRRVRALQRRSLLPVDGVTDPATWGALQDAACGLYDY